jgi:hypothetical protein
MTSRLNRRRIEVSGLAFEEELRRGPVKFLGGDVTVSEAGGKSVGTPTS